MRGLPAGRKSLRPMYELVPAHAGVTRDNVCYTGLKPARPRTCGGYPTSTAISPNLTDSSPHMRGLPGREPPSPEGRSLVPAHAGVTRGLLRMHCVGFTRPRTCGGYPLEHEPGDYPSASSPHMRGIPAWRRRRRWPRRLVPAHAGVTRGGKTSTRQHSPRPRTCGGYFVGADGHGRSLASSPHMRGLPGRSCARSIRALLVPAHAGVTRPIARASAD